MFTLRDDGNLVTSLHPVQGSACGVSNRANRVLFGGSAGGSKVLKYQGLILTPFGFKQCKDLKVGDLVNNPDGSVCEIIQLHPYRRHEKWVIKFHDGTETVTAEGHLWNAWRSGKSRKIKNEKVFGEASAQVVETKRLKEWFDKAVDQQKRGKRPNWPCIPVCEEQPFNVINRNPSELDPYLLGLLLGDGYLSKRQINITSVDHVHLKKELYKYDYRFDNDKEYRFVGADFQEIRDQLKKLNLISKKSDTKFIPREFKYRSIEERYALIQGLMDTDGSVDKRGHLSYVTVSKQLADDLAFVIRSLGGTVTLNKHEGAYKDDDGNKIKCKDYYKLYIKHRNPEKLFRLERKKKRAKAGVPDLMYKRVVGFEISGTFKGRCITVSHPNGLYITNDFIVTHNSHATRVFSIIEGYYIPHAQIYVVRSNFGALKNNHITGPTGYNEMLKPLVEAGVCSPVKAVKEGGWEIHFYNTGAVIHLNQLAHEGHLDKYTGAEITSLFLDESTQFKWEWIKFLHSRLRINKSIVFPEPFWWRDREGDVIYRRDADGELETRADGSLIEMTSYPRSMLLTNPVGESVHEHYETFIKKRKPFTIYYNKRTQEYQQFIPSRVTDNPSLGSEYLASLESLSPDLKAALRDGKWMTSFGSFFFEIYVPEIHIIKRDALSEQAIKFGYTEFNYDHGTSSPFSVQYHTKVNSCTLTNKEGNEIKVPHGSTIITGEIYGIKNDKWNTGLNLSVKEIADKIKDFNAKFTARYGLVTDDTNGPPRPGKADKEIFPEKPDQTTVATLFKNNGINFKPSYKGPGSIAAGLSLICDYFRNAILRDQTSPHLYILEDAAPYFIKEMNASTRNIKKPEQLTDESVDHAIDTCRYGLYTRILSSTEKDY